MQSSALSLKPHRWLPIKRSSIVESISALFILLFVYTAVSKLSDYAGFVSTLSRSPLVGNKAGAIGWALPVVELLVTLLLFIPRTRKYGLYASLALMVFFTGYLTYMIYFTTGDLPCSCGGVLNKMSWKQHLVFNIIFTLLGLTGVLLARKPFPNESGKGGA